MLALNCPLQFAKFDRFCQLLDAGLNCQLLDAGRGHLASLKRLLKYGADPNALAGYDPSRESERERVRVHV